MTTASQTVLLAGAISRSGLRTSLRGSVPAAVINPPAPSVITFEASGVLILTNEGKIIGFFIATPNIQTI